jgi:ribosomal protein S18 acetylase RimI-like enzyme/transcriptional regulator with XRE-family HTH domain
MITIREATGRDVAAIREIFVATYGTDYTDPRCYDDALLTRLVHSDDSLLLVAEDDQTGAVIGTASVDLEVGADSDLVGEFCRMAVHPSYRRRGVGKQLFRERLERVQSRLQVGLVEARASHPYSLRIAETHQFAVVGFLPQRWRVRQRESLALLVRYFGSALELRNNHPRIIPEVHALAHMALENCSLPPDAIVDEDATAYPPGGDFEIQELTTEGYAALLRIERGRLRHREIFGPARLHYGIFKLQARHSQYLIARQKGRIAGAVGFTLDPVDKAVRIFELIALDDEVIRFLLSDLERRCREKWDCLIEVDVSAHAPRMQRTLLELGFLPVAYLPALVFHEVERLDVVKMVRLLSPPQIDSEVLTPRCAALAELVMRLFHIRTVLPCIARAVGALPLFKGLTDEQVARLAGVCSVATYAQGEQIFSAGEPSHQLQVIVDGEVAITVPDSDAPVGVVRRGECLGERSLLSADAHSATAKALTRLETAVLEHGDLHKLMRLRPDIGLCIYRNLAMGLGEKLRRLDHSLAEQYSRTDSNGLENDLH